MLPWILAKKQQIFTFQSTVPHACRSSEQLTRGSFTKGGSWGVPLDLLSGRRAGQALHRCGTTMSRCPRLRVLGWEWQRRDAERPGALGKASRSRTCPASTGSRGRCRR